MSKYRAVRTTVDGITFASKREAARYGELKLLQKAGKIRHLLLQPIFQLQPKFTDARGKKYRAINYIADFSYWDTKTKAMAYEDVKGKQTDVFKLKHKMLMYNQPDIDFRITK